MIRVHVIPVTIRFIKKHMCGFKCASKKADTKISKDLLLEGLGVTASDLKGGSGSFNSKRERRRLLPASLGRLQPLLRGLQCCWRK